MSDPITPNPYETLGVDKDADLVTIRKAHRKLVLQCHPDRVRDDNKENAAQKFTEVQQAYYVLSDETSRQQHDARVRLSELRWEVREERYRGYKPSQASRVWEARPRGMNSQGASSHQERPRATESNNTLFHREKTRVRKSEHANDRYPLHERRRPLNGTREREESRTERDTNRALYNEGGSKDRDTGANSLPGKSTTTNRIPCPPVWGRFGDKERRRQAIPSHLTREKRVTSISRKRESKRSQTLAYSSPEQTLIRSLEQHEKHRRQQEIFEQQLLRFLGPPPPIPKRIAKKQTASILALEGFVDDNFVCTKPDTGARANLMALSFAESIGLHLFDREPESQVSFLMANGCLINSIGRVTARWRFKKGETESYTISFYVFAECCFDVIIGDSFLRETQTMSTNEHRLSWVPRPEWALYVRRINLLGCPSQRMKGKLGGDEVFALADSGAEGGNLVSYEYAKRRGWLTGDLFGKRNLLQFPDGSQSRTEGQVRKVWRYHGRRFPEFSSQIHGSTSPF